MVYILYSKKVLYFEEDECTACIRRQLTHTIQVTIRIYLKGNNDYCLNTLRKCCHKKNSNNGGWYSETLCSLYE